MRPVCRVNSASMGCSWCSKQLIQRTWAGSSSAHPKERFGFWETGILYWVSMSLYTCSAEPAQIVMLTMWFMAGLWTTRYQFDLWRGWRLSNWGWSHGCFLPTDSPPIKTPDRWGSGSFSACQYSADSVTHRTWENWTLFIWLHWERTIASWQLASPRLGAMWPLPLLTFFYVLSL